MLTLQYLRINLVIPLILVTGSIALSALPTHATILFQSHAGSGICDTIVPRSEWNTEYGPEPREQSRMWYRCDTPVPGMERTTYFRDDYDPIEGGGWNYKQGLPNINLIPGATYYLGLFFRVDKTGGRDVWDHYTSSDKLFEFHNTSARAIITVGYNDWAEKLTPNKFPFGIYLSPLACTGCIYEQVAPNYGPYAWPNYYLADYNKWYALVLGFTPSTGGSAKDGRLEFWVNGIKTHDYQNIKTQDSSAPTVNRFYHSGTIAQPQYNAPAHLRKFDQFIFADSLADMTTLGLMSDPESNSTPPPSPTPDTQAPTPPGSLSASVISPTQINLSWSASIDNVGVTGYRLERCTGAGCTNFTQIAAPTNTGFQNTTVIAGTTYQYRMRATDAAGNLSGYSSIVSATTPNVPTPPPTSTPPLGSNLVAAYSFNEASGTTASDASGNTNIGTLTNGPAWTAGKSGGALSFDGVDDYMEIPDSPSLNITGNTITLSMWVNIPAGVAADQYGGIVKGSGTNTERYMLGLNTVGGYKIDFRTYTAARVALQPVTTITPDTWNHFAGTYDGTTMRAYINGVEVGTIAQTGNLDASTAPVLIGRRTLSDNRFFPGLIDDVRIYTRALSISEIQSDMNTPLGGSPPASLPDTTPPAIPANVRVQ